MKCQICLKETDNPKFCSKSCAGKNVNFVRIRKSTRQCATCSKPINAKNKFCSKDCKSIYVKPTQTKPKSTIDKPKTCPMCGVLITYENSHTSSGKQIKCYCKKCKSKKNIIRAQQFKLTCIEYKGGSCEQCGYNKCPAALDFHHRDPSQKDFGLANVRTNRFDETTKVELDKCSLLCAVCHRELHYYLAQLAMQ